MGITEFVMLVNEIIGTVAFAVSGSLVAIDRKLDLFGVVFIGCITATGGGIIRDITIGITPPSVFKDPLMLLVATLTSVSVFVVAYIYRLHFHSIRERVDKINNVFDAFGLAAFSVMGTERAVTAGFGDNILLSVCLGMLTGVGGGILRDMMTNSTPYVFKKHIYALASIAGSIIYYFAMRFGAGIAVSTFGALAIVVTIRMLAAKFRWSLPKVINS